MDGHPILRLASLYPNGYIYAAETENVVLGGLLEEGLQGFPYRRSPSMGKREEVMKRNAHPQGTDNVLLDLGFDDAAELSTKTALALKLNELIDKRGLNQTETAAITGMTQPKVSQIRRYKLQNISLERLMQALVSLDQHVEIVVQPAQKANIPGITVAATPPA